MFSNQLKNTYLTHLKDIKFLTLCLFTFFLGYEYWEELSIVGNFTITKTLGLVYFLLSILYYKKSFSINKDNKYQIFYLFIFSWIFILATLNGHLLYAQELNLVDILTYLQFIIFYWVVTNEVRRSNYKKNLLLIFLIVGVLSMYFLLINGIGLQSSKSGDTRESFDNIQRVWFMGLNPNVLGSLASFASISLAYLLIKSKINKIYKLLFTTLFIPLVHLIFLSGSLGSFLSLIIGIFLLLFLNKKFIFSRNLIYTTILIIFLLFYINNYGSIDLNSSSYLIEKLHSFLDSGNTSGRVEIWEYNFSIAIDSFILGLGPNTNLRTSHNVFLDIFIWTGILGLIAYSLFILSVFKKCIYDFLKYNDTYGIAIISCIILLLFKSGGGFQLKYIWLLLAVITVPTFRVKNAKITN